VLLVVWVCEGPVSFGAYLLFCLTAVLVAGSAFFFIFGTVATTVVTSHYCSPSPDLNHQISIEQLRGD
jgi:hypothetical protein